MKLKKLMRKNGVKFPEGANYAAQDENWKVWFYVGKPTFREEYGMWDGALTAQLARRALPKLASNYQTKVVTREEYEA